jgi:tetratricopeptide (TPR) repeat protein
MYAFALQNDNELKMVDALSWIFVVYRQSGDYEKSFEYARKAYDLALKTKNRISIANTLYGMAQLHLLIEDYPRALNYFRQVHQMDDQDTRSERVRTDNDIWFKMEFTEVFSHLNEFDSAWHYYNLYKPEKHKAVYFRIYWISTGECHYLQKNYDQALRNFQLGLADHQKLNDRNEVMRALLDIGKTYVALNNDTAALGYGREGLNIALQARAKQYIRDGYQILSTVYDRLHRPDSANFYFRQYIVLKEEVLNDQTKAKFAAYNYDQTIALIQKEKEIQEAKLQRELFMKRFLIGGIILLVLSGFIILRAVTLHRKNERLRLEHEITIQKLSSEKAKSELQQQTIELEMRALRAQMNPHFIFNSLNSINRFILQNNRKKASEYLTKFSKLIRLILQNSQTSMISLENELESLQLYLELEALRFDNHFDYAITLENDLDISSIKVPPLIIQPYVENAIWHGLMHKEEKGLLQIELFMLDEMLACKITDNGIGRMKSAALKSKPASTHKSMGMQITATRIEMLQRENKSNASIKITDLMLPDGTAGGTEVLLTIPVCYD